MTVPTQTCVTPPAPGLDKEEPELWNEDDIPTDDRGTVEDEDEVQPPQREGAK